MTPFWKDTYGNPSSRHSPGYHAKQAVEDSRRAIAELIGSRPEEVVFTSGATEAANLAIKGVTESTSKTTSKHVIVAATEHPAVIEPCAHLEQQGYDITRLPIGRHGILDVRDLIGAVRDNTVLACVMWVNNETGVVNPIAEIASALKERKVLFFCDATQGIGKIPISVSELGIDLLALSGHKFHGPKGVGALYVRRGVEIVPLLHGGGQEGGIRSGTLNVPAIVGLGEASRRAKETMTAYRRKVRELRDYIETELLKIPDSHLNGHPSERIHNVTNIRFEGVNAEALITSLKPIVISNGSACSSGKDSPSHVLSAMGLSDEEARCSVRISLSHLNTRSEVGRLVKEIHSKIQQLRELHESWA
ncbi:MAG: cysteine desulfurase family protein [Cytophagales bacterium]|nr:cysteine desulfurase family protein [Cytophagales bacterium]